MRENTAHAFPFQVSPLVPGPRRWTLELLFNGLAIRRFPITTQGVTIGRSISDAQIIVDDPRISMRHAWIGVVSGNDVVADFGSTNGTYVNAVERGRVITTVLSRGDIVILASPDAMCFRIARHLP